MDIHSGEMVSMVSAPSFDLNKLSRGIEVKNGSGLSIMSVSHWSIRPCGLHAPGSTFKMLVALAALEES